MNVQRDLHRIVAERVPFPDLSRDSSLHELDEIELTDLMMTVEDEMKVLLANPLKLRSVGQLEDEVATQLEYMTRTELVLDGVASPELNARTASTVLAGTAAWAHLQSGRDALAIVEGFIGRQRASLSVLVHLEADGALTLTVMPADDNDYALETDTHRIASGDSILRMSNLVAGVLAAFREVHAAAYKTSLVAGFDMSVEIMADLRAPSEWVTDDFS